MDADIQEYIKKIRAYKKRDQFDEALSLCNEFVEYHPDAWVAYREKADIFKAKNDVHSELTERKRLGELGTEEPSDYYDLARLCLKMGENTEAVRWSDIGIQQCIDSQNFYYHQALHFYKANALVNLGQYQEVLECCKVLDDGYSTYLSGIGVKTKEDLMSLASRELDKTSSGKVWKFDQGESD